MTSKICAHYLRTQTLCRRHCLHCLLLRLKLRDEGGAETGLASALTASLARTRKSAVRGASWSRRAARVAAASSSESLAAN